MLSDRRRSRAAVQSWDTRRSIRRTPIQCALSPKAMLRNAAERTVNGLQCWIGPFIREFKSCECIGYSGNAGHDQLDWDLLCQLGGGLYDFASSSVCQITGRSRASQICASRDDVGYFLLLTARSDLHVAAPHDSQKDASRPPSMRAVTA
jgi:hypothetical protein